MAIGPDTIPPVTTTASLTVAENAAATKIGIVAPTDPNYSASQLSVTVTGLPTDGTVLLADGVTAVTNGETLTIAQLTGLMFKQAAGIFGQSPTFTYSVSDPSGNKAVGTATLAIGPDTIPPTTTAALSTVAENAAATAIGITAPTDPDYSASQLSVTVTGLPTDGTVLLSDRVTAVTNGEILTVAQLTGLLFKLTAGAFGRNSSSTYNVSDPSGNKTAGSATLAIGAGTSPPTMAVASLTVTENGDLDRDCRAGGPELFRGAAQRDGDRAADRRTVLLADGVTAVTNGEILTVAQLTGLMFKPTAASQPELELYL